MQKALQNLLATNYRLAIFKRARVTGDFANFIAHERLGVIANDIYF